MMEGKPPRAPRYPCLTRLTTRGTFYDVGYNVGLNFSQNIKLFFAESSDNIQDKLLLFYHTRAGRQYYEEALAVTEACFPRYLRELRGTSDGSGVPFEQLFAANIFEKILPDSLASREDVESTQDSQGRQHARASLDHSTQLEFGCTTLYVSQPGLNSTGGCMNEGLKLLLHNEDSDPLVKPYGYLLTADIEEDGVVEGFTAFCYPGSLPGRAYGFNKHGVVVTTNALYPDRPVRGAPSRVFLSRALLAARDIPDAYRILQNEPYGVAYGFCANLSTAGGDMAAIEVGPDKPCAQLHVQRIEEEGCSDKPCHYYHFNSYKHLQVTEIDGLVSSKRRAIRTAELPPPRSLRDALAVMGDTADSLGPVFRNPCRTDLGETVGTAVFDVTNREVLIYQGNPASNTHFVKLPMYV